MIIDSLRSTLITFFQGKISSLFIFLLSLSIATTVVEYGVLKRENAFDFLGPKEHPKSLFTFLCNEAPLGEITIYTKGTSNEYREYRDFFIRSSHSIKNHKTGLLEKNITQRHHEKLPTSF